MPLTADLLAPISEAEPAGADLRWDDVYRQIKEARREDDDAPMGAWQYARKTADWALVARLATEALQRRTKDLQIAAWLAEALLRREGLGGLRSGLELLRDLVERYWDGLYPPIEDGDLGVRAAPLAWLGARLAVPVRGVPVDDRRHDYLQYRASREVGYEAAATSTDAQQRRQALIEEGKLPPETVDAGIAATPKAWYRQAVADLDACVAAIGRLDALGDTRLGEDAPTYRPLLDALDEVGDLLRSILKQKLEVDPDPPEPVAEAAAPEAAQAGGAAGEAGGAEAAARGPVARPVAPVDRADAGERIAEIARFLRRTAPHDPAAYLLLRGYRWGELRVAGAAPDPRLLEAPPTAVRSRLKGLLLDGAWPALLEAAEDVMASAYGRGWLDLQRYAVTACAGLGAAYGAVAEAIVGELGALLRGMPTLAELTLMDDTPTANAETQRWLREVVLAGELAPLDGDAAAAAAAVPPPAPVTLPGDGAGGPGANGATIDALLRAVDRERSRRGRFVRQVQLASAMVDGGLEAVARPILEQLVADVEAHKLEDWEAGGLVARPLALLHRCLARADAEPSTRQSLYLRICRLDPAQAIAVARS